MSFLPVLPLLMFLAFGPARQQLGIEERLNRYFVMEIQATDQAKRFEFEAVQLTRSGKESSLRRFDGKAPFKLSLVSETFLILRGKKGEAKTILRYKFDNEVKSSYQYLGKGEAIVVQFVPKLVGGSGTRWWTEGKLTAPQLSVMIMTKE
jgi:hypothetical protein